MENLFRKINLLKSYSLAQIILFSSNILFFIFFIICLTLLGVNFSDMYSAIGAKVIQASALGVFAIFAIIIFVMV